MNTDEIVQAIDEEIERLQKVRDGTGAYQEDY
jgi:hypothetical protein